MVDCSNFRLIVPLKLSESYSSEAKKDIKVLTLQAVLTNFFSFRARLKKCNLTAHGLVGYAKENEETSCLEDCPLFFLPSVQKI